MSHMFRDLARTRVCRRIDRQLCLDALKPRPPKRKLTQLAIPVFAIVAAMPTLMNSLAAAEEAGRLPRLAVLPFKNGTGISHEQAQSIAGFVCDEFKKAGSYEIIDRNLMKERMDERDLSDAGVTELTIVGKEKGVEKIVSGQISALGGSWSIEMRIVDVATGHLDDTKSNSASGPVQCELLARNLAREMLGKAVFADNVRNQKELARRMRLEALWQQQKDNLKVTFKQAKKKKDRNGRFFEVNVVNTHKQQAQDVVIQLGNADATEVKSVTFKYVKPNKNSTRELRWTAKQEPVDCVVVSVGGDFSLPRCGPCKGNGYRNCIPCSTNGYKDCTKCKGTGKVYERYKVKKGFMEESKPRPVDCKPCEGTGRVSCGVCKKLGRIACPKCRATGHQE